MSQTPSYLSASQVTSLNRQMDKISIFDVSKVRLVGDDVFEFVLVHNYNLLTKLEFYF